MTSPIKIVALPVQYIWHVSEKIGLNKAMQIGFKFFKSYGDEPKDLAKLFQVFSEWAVVLCKNKSTFKGFETAQKVAAFSKQAKCFLSFSGICTQLVKARNALVPLIEQERTFTATALKTVIDQGTGLCASAVDIITLLNLLGFISSKNKYMSAIKIGNCIATVLGAISRLGSDANNLQEEYAQGRLVSRASWKKTVSILGHVAVFSLGALPLLERFKGYKPLDKNFFLKLSTVSVLSTLFNKHIQSFQV
ncbi:hypothetical protein RHABOEDO_000415 [Candidatus Rhabdochlamydia oedothoracis]|uniref:Uncharacterized protein n=1 Tax=Candidatus Rhabdochlamydia oedothoracis TaxID=2720720 RepID=A0ABX8UZ97_9BACT|nr:MULTISPECIES: hypothetical protein [Rhabdochlamydia]KAG6558849.1 hypothetical protein RHOW815_001162 [Candidatus Rhabdochlamydia sp. W815]QYF48287.1 hypothetical protein RHABOEDO_000415 [Candidatus Rhabdochlamydia oedothoracis]